MTLSGIAHIAATVVIILLLIVLLVSLIVGTKNGIQIILKSKKCTTCARPLILKKQEIYTVKIPAAPFTQLITPPQVVDVTDCTHCGCQNILAERVPPNTIVISRLETQGNVSETSTIERDE